MADGLDAVEHLPSGAAWIPASAASPSGLIHARTSGCADGRRDADDGRAPGRRRVRGSAPRPRACCRHRARVDRVDRRAPTPRSRRARPPPGQDDLARRLPPAARQERDAVDRAVWPTAGPRHGWKPIGAPLRRRPIGEDPSGHRPRPRLAVTPGAERGRRQPCRSASAPSEAEDEVRAVRPAANAWSNGAWEPTRMSSASVDASVASSRTAAMMAAWSLRRRRPAGESMRRRPSRHPRCDRSSAIAPSTRWTTRCATWRARASSWVTRTMVWPRAVEFFEEGECRLAVEGVQGAGRLVREQDGRPVDDGPGNRHPLPLAAAQGRRETGALPARAQAGPAGRRAPAASAAPRPPGPPARRRCRAPSGPRAGGRTGTRGRPCGGGNGRRLPRPGARREPATTIAPAVGRSSAPIEVEQRRLAAARGPMTAVIRPSSISRSIPASAATRLPS